MDNVIVAGGAGFLGSHLCTELLKKNKFVYCVDNLFTGRLLNIEPFLQHSNFKFIEHDIILPLQAYFKDKKITEIYNMACPASPVHYQSEPIFTTKTAVIGTLNLLELALEKNAKIFQASTSEVYGESQVHPQSEDYFGNVDPCGERSCYNSGKRCAESLCMDYYRRYGLRVKVARIFNTYGPHMDPEDGRVISNFIVQGLNNKALTIFGDGQQTRSFCYVDDIIQAIMKFMDKENIIPGPINLGNPAEIKVLDLAKLVFFKLGKTNNMTFQKPKVGDPQRRCPSIELANKVLDWQPTTNLEVGLEQTINYFRSSGDMVDHKHMLESEL